MTETTQTSPGTNPASTNNANWERQMIFEITDRFMKEQKTTRRWNIAFRILYIIMGFFFLMALAILSHVIMLSQPSKPFWRQISPYLVSAWDISFWRLQVAPGR